MVNALMVHTPIPAVFELDQFKKNVAGTLACLNHLDQTFLPEGHLLHTLSLGIFKASYTHARRVLIIDKVTSSLGLKLGSTTAANLRETRTVMLGVRISRLDVLEWAGDNPGTHDNNRKRVVLARAVYDELQIRLNDESLRLASDQREKEESLARDLEIMFSPDLLDSGSMLTDGERRVSTMQNRTLDQALSDFSKLPRVKRAEKDLRNRAVTYICTI